VGNALAPNAVALFATCLAPVCLEPCAKAFRAGGASFTPVSGTSTFSHKGGEISSDADRERRTAQALDAAQRIFIPAAAKERQMVCLADESVEVLCPERLQLTETEGFVRTNVGRTFAK